MWVRCQELGQDLEVVRCQPDGGTLFVFDQRRGTLKAEHSAAAVPCTMVTDRAHFRSTKHTAAHMRQKARALVDHSPWRRLERENA